MKIGVSVIIFLLSVAGFGQQLVYRAINPAFGGETFNHQWLLNAANAQNSFKDPEAQDQKQSEIEQFAANLNRQLLSQISRSLLNSQLGENGLQPGTFSFGSLSLDIFETAEGLVINILDTSTGEETQIIVPNP